MRPILVGEANPYGGDPDHALYPYPVNSAGGRLCRKVLGLTGRQYLRRFDRANLCAREWSTDVARRAARELLADPAREKFVLLGARVCAAFGVACGPFAFLGSPGTRRAFVVLPHPSGRCRAWNDPGAVERARAVLVEAGVLPVAPPTAEEVIADLPSALCTTRRPARCENCGGLVEDAHCHECGPPRY